MKRLPIKAYTKRGRPIPGTRHLRVITRNVVVWKKADLCDEDGYLGPIVVKLLLRKGTLIRVPRNLLGEPLHCDKHRAEKATVLGFRSTRGFRITLKRKQFVESSCAVGFKYRIGRVVRPKAGFFMGDQACASGIHFFVDFDEAAKY